ncbi:MAG TPA: fluoride efflux transporter CrcB [Solirubrobacterales bacterium]|nr:fluoride efflux transporter CrcB [Solirubrobacterales bacterium]
MRSQFDLRQLAAIYVGGVLGALARVGLAEALPHSPGAWPWATFAVNMAGALALGYFFARLRDHPEDSFAHPFLTTGICGTLTTFSTLQLELFEMVDAGYLPLAAGYVAATFIVGYLCIRLGIAAERRPRVWETAG